MCLLPLLLFPTTFIEELLLVVEATNCFGSGVAGLSALTHTHTPPQCLTSPWKEKPSRTLHSCRASIVYSFLTGFDCSSHAQEFLCFPTSFFSLWNHGCCGYRKSVFLSSFAWSLCVFSVIMLPRTGCIPHVCCELCSLILFGTVIFPRGWLCCRGLPYTFGAVVISFEESFWPR